MRGASTRSESDEIGAVLSRHAVFWNPLPSAFETNDRDAANIRFGNAPEHVVRKAVGNTLSRSIHSTFLRTVCSPRVPSAMSKLSAVYSTLSKSCLNGGSPSCA
jgi:hypothetical protein